MAWRDQAVLGEELFFGRDAGNDVRIQDTTASRHHARMQRVDHTWLVIDLSSNNGTFVNGNQVKEHVLSHGDQILVGKTLLVSTLGRGPSGRKSGAV